MKDKMVIVLCNLKPSKLRGVLSEAMSRACLDFGDSRISPRPGGGVVPGKPEEPGKVATSGA